MLTLDTLDSNGQFTFENSELCKRDIHDSYCLGLPGRSSRAMRWKEEGSTGVNIIFVILYSVQPSINTPQLNEYGFSLRVLLFFLTPTSNSSSLLLSLISSSRNPFLDPNPRPPTHHHLPHHHNRSISQCTHTASSPARSRRFALAPDCCRCSPSTHDTYLHLSSFASSPITTCNQHSLHKYRNSSSRQVPPYAVSFYFLRKCTATNIHPLCHLSYFRSSAFRLCFSSRTRTLHSLLSASSSFLTISDLFSSPHLISLPNRTSRWRERSSSPATTTAAASASWFRPTPLRRFLRQRSRLTTGSIPSSDRPRTYSGHDARSSTITRARRALARGRPSRQRWCWRRRARRRRCGRRVGRADGYAVGECNGVFLGIGGSTLVDSGGRSVEPKKAGCSRDGHVGQCRIWDLEGDELTMIHQLRILIFSHSLCPSRHSFFPPSLLLLPLPLLISYHKKSHNSQSR